MVIKKISRNNFKTTSIYLLIFFVLLIFVSCLERNESDKLIIVDQNHPEASDTGEGTREKPFKTISRAAAMASPGHTIIVHEGIYRERVAPKRGGKPEQPITYKAAPDENVVISAADIWEPEWIHVTGNVFKAKLGKDLFEENKGGYNPFETKMDLRTRHEDHTVTGIPCYEEGYKISLTLGQVIVNNELFMEVSSLSPSVFKYKNTWKYDSEEQSIYIHFGEGIVPEEQKIEITTRKQCFAPFIRGLGYIHVKGFIMKYAGNQHPGGFWKIPENKQAGALSTRSGHHWIIEDNVIKKNKSIGIDFGSEGAVEGVNIPRDSVRNHIIRDNIISDNGIGGIMGAGSRNVVIEDNLIKNNNTLKMRSWEVGGIKTHFFNGTIRRNIIIDNYCYGIWLDNDYTGARVTKNIVHNNRDRAIFLEMGEGPALVDNNIISSTKIGPLGEGKNYYGDGIYAHDAGGFTITNNFIYDNKGFGISMRTLPGRAIPTENIKIFNNFIVYNEEGTLNIPYDGTYAGNNCSENNLFAGKNSFVINTWGEKPEDFEDQLENIKDTVNNRVSTIELIEWSGFGSNGSEGVILNFGQWQKVRNWDNKSKMNVISNVEIDENMVLKFKLDNTPQELKWIPQDEVKEDFFGKKHSDDFYVGPFLNIQKGKNKINLLK